MLLLILFVIWTFYAIFSFKFIGIYGIYSNKNSTVLQLLSLGAFNYLGFDQSFHTQCDLISYCFEDCSKVKLYFLK